MKTLLCAVALALLTGCAAGIRVDYLTDVPGATIYENGRPLGITPVSVHYEPDAAFKGGGCQTVQGTTVVWASGARESVSNLRVCASKGWVQHYQFTRPNVAGRDVDLNYALQLQRNALMRQQADAALLRAITPPPSVSCMTTGLGHGDSITNCR